jgi:hypothetical protein
MKCKRLFLLVFSRGKRIGFFMPFKFILTNMGGGDIKKNSKSGDGMLLRAFM